MPRKPPPRRLIDVQIDQERIVDQWVDRSGRLHVLVSPRGSHSHTNGRQGIIATAYVTDASTRAEHDDQPAISGGHLVLAPRGGLRTQMFHP